MGAVIPLEADDSVAVEPAPPPARALRPLDAGTSIMDGFLAESLSVVTPAEPGGAIFALRGITLGVYGGVVTEENAEACVELENDGVRLSTPEVTTSDMHLGNTCPASDQWGHWADAQRVVILDGQTHWLKHADAALIRSFGVISLDTNEQGIDFGVTRWTGTDPGGPLRYGWNLLEAGALFQRTLSWALPALEPVDAHIAIFSDGVMALSRLKGISSPCPSWRDSWTPGPPRTSPRTGTTCWL